MFEGLSVISVSEGLRVHLLPSAAAALRRHLCPVVLVQFNRLWEFIVQLDLCFLEREKRCQGVTVHIVLPIPCIDSIKLYFGCL